VRTGGYRLDQLVGEDQVQHRRFVDHQQVHVEGVVPVVTGLPAGLQLE